MKKSILLIAVMLLSFAAATAQSCLPEGITFTNQTQINNFHTNYPWCTEIEGNVIVEGNSITNLNGLSVLTYIGGYLVIKSNSSLTSLVGLEGLTSIGGDLIIRGNALLASLAGIENITSIGGSMRIGTYSSGNPSLASLAGLENLTSIGGNLDIWRNQSLTSLTGLEGLTSIGGSLLIQDNFAMTSLTGLVNLTSVGGSLTISNNTALSACNAEWLCNVPAIVSGSVTIQGNAPGCLSLVEAALSCGGMACLPNGIHNFISQNDVDNFSMAFPGCNSTGSISIIGGNISNLNGLSVLTSITGKLEIGDTPSLTSLSGLNNLNFIGDGLGMGNTALINMTGLEGLNSIGGYLFLGTNPSLISLAGLDNLTSIGEGLYIGNQWAVGNPSLVSLDGLDNLTSIGSDFELWNNPFLDNLSGLNSLTSVGGRIFFWGNSSLTSLSGLSNLNSLGGALMIFYSLAINNLAGLENIAAGSITEINISYNSSLSTCHVQSICDYLAATPSGYVTIEDNAPGCNSPEEVAEACESSSIEVIPVEDGFTVFPNPFTNQLNIEISADKHCRIAVTVYNNMGQLVARPVEKELYPGVNQLQWDSSILIPGLYLLHLQVGQKTITQKIIKY